MLKKIPKKSLRGFWSGGKRVEDLPPGRHITDERAFGFDLWLAGV